MATVRRVDLLISIIFISFLSRVTGQDDGFKPKLRRGVADPIGGNPNPKFAAFNDLNQQEKLVDADDRSYRRAALDPNAGGIPAVRNVPLDPGVINPHVGGNNPPPRRQRMDPAIGNDGLQLGNQQNKGFNLGIAGNQGLAGKLPPGQLLPGQGQRVGHPPNQQQQQQSLAGNQRQLGHPPASNLRKAPIKIAESPACKEDVKHYCSGSSATNNFAVLDCLQNDEKGVRDISAECQHFVWTYKRNLTTDIRFDSAASEVCKEELAKSDCDRLERGKGLVIPCLIDIKENVSVASCRQFLNKMASIVFSDYRLIYKFTDACGSDIDRLGCGRLDSDDNDAPHSQGKTVECLSEKVGSLNESCKHEILRIAELQADDFHMDRPLFYACREDRERFCRSTKAGSGKVYKCLYRHKLDKGMSTECQNMLVRRQQTMQDNYKVNKGLTDACHQDIKTYRCLKGDVPKGRQGRLSTILLCLEGAIKDDNPVAPECISELQEMRRSLMEDYKISPDIVHECSTEIRNHCDGLQRDGKTIHCLMDIAKSSRLPGHEELTSQCRRALEDLLKEADAAEDIRIDPLLNQDCRPVIDTACKNIKPGSGKIMDCLMDHIDTEIMSPDCQERLMEMQYFVARDFKLDPRLYRYCKLDAKEFCGAPANWYDPQDMNPDQGPFTFSCLYRVMKTSQAKGESKLSRACAFEVRRVMRQRAVSVDLEPRIEEPCLKDLGKFCSEDTEKGEEVECLEDHYEELTKECQMAVGNFTEDVDKDPKLDHILMISCTPMIKQFCQNELEAESTKPGDIMQCLIKYKNHADMERKCAAGVEHHQLTTMKDYTFSYKFKEACKGDVNTLCRGMKKKSEIVSCLSETVRNDTLLEDDHRLSGQCRKQLRFELLQRGENVNLNPELADACREDMKMLCKNVSPGNAQMIECLRNKQKDLTAPCRAKIFKREQIEARESDVDFFLVTKCKTMIKRYCMDQNPTELLSCLKQFKEKDDFNSDCRKAIENRQVVQSKDFRLNPELQKNCKLDIPKFCKNEFNSRSEGAELEGRVINCLKIQFAAHRLSRDCEDHVGVIIREAALDYREDPVLTKACRKEIDDLCLRKVAGSVGGSDHGDVEECLKEELARGKIQNADCMKEIVRTLSESKADINVDPLLHKTCALDIKHYCFDVKQGEGRQMSCMLAALEDGTIKLTTKCRQMLQERVTMWEYAAKVAPPETIVDLASQITTSKSRNFFVFVIFGVLGMMFFGGLFCGRVTKRIRREEKMK